ncbi:glycosyl hydrolase [Pseudoduganella armeniaca]|nr:glycosyl hydrolase [Pseudoduganella armeniaca]
MRHLLSFLGAAMLAGAVHAAPAVVVSPYKHLPQHWPDNSVITVAQGALLAQAERPAALTWAFATGECGSETWNGRPGRLVADANTKAFARAGVGYIVSTGGQGGVFTCASDAGMEAFIARYDTPRLLGFDFDIEAEQTPAQIRALTDRIAVAQRKRPRLRFSFTVATHAASDGSQASLNPMAERVLAAVRASGIKDYVLNLMVMDYGPASGKVCVLRGERCDMGASALQAARNVQAKYGVPFGQIELTPMIGVNDVVENVFTLDDAATVARGVRELGLAGLHYWSLDRDVPCSREVKGADAQCSTMPGVPAGAYWRAFEQAVRR